MDSVILENLSVINPILYVVAAINFIIATIVISRGVRSPINIFFGLLSVSVGLWAFAIAGFYTNAYSNGAFNWIIWTHFFALLTSLSFLYFSFIFPKRIFTKKIIYVLPLIPAIVITYLIFFTTSVIGSTNGIKYEVNMAYNLYAAILLGYFFGSYFLLYKQYRNAENEQSRGQVKYILVGYTVGSFLASFTDLILPSVFLNIFSFTWLGPVFSIILVGSIFMSMARYHLFNAKVILSEVFALSIIFLLMINVFIEGTGTGPLIVKISTLLVIVLFSYRFVKSVYQEVQTREALETVLHFMSHEVKGALGKTRGLLSFIQDGTLGEVSPKLREMSGDLMRTVTESLDSSEDILNSSNIKRGTFTYQMAPFDFADLVTNLVNVYKPQAEHKNLLFAYNTPGTPITLMGDQKHLAHVAKNLIDNAVRYTKQGSITVTITNGEKAIQLRVADTGYGLTEEDKKTLFTEGGKGKESQKVNTESTGYGLFIVKSIVVAHGGKVWAESAGRDQGSTFIVELPKKQIPNTPADPQIKSTQPATQPTPSPSTSSNLPTTPQSVALSPKESKE